MNYEEIQEKSYKYLLWLRKNRDKVNDDFDLRHSMNKVCDRLDVLDSKLRKRTHIEGR